MKIEINKTEVNVNSKNYSFDRIHAVQETEKAYKFETTDSFGSYLHDYNVTFWLPKSVVDKNAVVDSFGIVNVNLPFWFDLSINKTQI